MGDPPVTTGATDAPSGRRRLLLITDDHVYRGPRGPTARLASTRLRLLVALEALNAAGHGARLVANTTPEHIRQSREFAAAGRILVGKVFQDYRRVLSAARAAGKTIVLDVTDDLERFPVLAPMRALVGLADAVTVPSDGLDQMVRGWTGGRVPVTRIADPVEGGLHPPGGDLRRQPLRLLWFGSPTNAGFLNPHMPGLIALASRCALDLTIVSTGAEAFEGLVSRYDPARGQPLRVLFVEWSQEAQAHALAQADLVLLPGDIAADSGLKSANRLIAAIAAGRLCVASPLPSYRPFAGHALLVDDMAAGIEAARALPPERISEAVRAGQALIERDYSRTVIGRSWVEVLAG